MKDSAEYAARLKKLCSKLKKDYEGSESVELLDPLEALIEAILSYEVTQSKARSVLKKIKSEFVDFNELRVARYDELTAVMGKSYPQAREASEQLTGVLNFIFEKEDKLSLDILKEMGKREAKAYLESLEQTNAYIVSYVMLYALGAHAFPMHPGIYQMFQEEEVVNPKSDMADIQGFMERQIAASDIHYVYGMLRDCADGHKAEKKPAKKISAKKTVKKVAKNK